MTTKTLLAALALTVLPAVSFAMCSGAKQQQAQSCGAGAAWDAEAQQCVEIVNS